MKLLIDADIYAFRAVAATEEETDWGDDIWSLSTDLKVAKKIVEEEFEKFYDVLRSKDARSRANCTSRDARRHASRSVTWRCVIG